MIHQDYAREADVAWGSRYCPECGTVQLHRIGYVHRVGHLSWLRCTSCGMGLVNNHGVISPGVRPLGVPRGLPPVEAEAWQEVRASLSVGAYTASVMLCRKLLMHVAVGHGLPAKNDNDRAPSFVECVDYLETAGIITKLMRPWVDRIKNVGNEANHDLDPPVETRALDVARFTEQLLKLAYEMDAIMAESNPAEADPE